MAVGTTNRITLRIGVVFDKAGLEVEASKVRKQLDGKMADSTKQQTKALKDQQKALTKRNGEMKKEKSILAELGAGWNKMVANFLKFTVVAGISMAVTVSLKQMKDLIFELDTAMTNLSIVTGATASELAMVDAQATKLTTSLGALKGEVINSITEFARAGFDLADAMLLTERATMAANVGFTELDRITTFLIAGLKSFKLEAEDSVRVLDVLFRVANVTAIDLEGIGEAFLRSANTLKVAGATLEESASLIAAANESIQDPAKVGTALKTIASRLRGVGDEGEVVPTLAKDFEAVGIAIQNADGSFRNIYDVFEEFSEVYKNLDDLTKESLLEKLAGKRQKNIMIGLLENFDVAQMALEEAMNSAGAVALANEKYLDSLEGKTKILTETWGQFLRQLADSEGLKLLIDLLTAAIQGITFLTNGIPGLVVALAGLTYTFTAFGAALALGTGGLNLILPAIAGVIGLVSGANGLNSVFGMATETADQLSIKILELNSTMASHEEKIKKLIALGDDRTDAEDKLLEVLQKKLDIERELAKVANISLANKLVEDAEKSTKAMGEILSQYEALTGDDLLGESEQAIDDATKKLQGFETDLLTYQGRLLEVMSTTEDGSEANILATNAYDDLTDAIARVNKVQESLGFTIRENVVESEDLITEQERLAIALYEVERLLATAPSDYQLLSDAMTQMKDNGYLTQDMLDSIKERFPELVTETGLAKNAFITMAQGFMDASKQSLTATLHDLRIESLAIQKRIMMYRNAEADIAKLTDPFGTRARIGQDAVAGGILISSAEKDLKDINNLLAEVRNADKIITGIDKTREDAAKKKAEKVETPLTALEKKLRDVTQEIALLDKEMARSEGVEEQIRINNLLLAKYKEQKSAIEAVRDEYIKNNQGLAKNTAEYDDYIDQLYKFALQIEDVTNSMFNLTSANSQMRKEMSQSVNDLRELMTKMIEQELKDEISKYKDLIDLAKEQLDIKLKQLDAEKDLADFAKSRLEKEKSLSKIVSKMDSLRAAASQGDMKAINELNQLEEERIAAQESIDSLINEKSFELRKENLQNQFDEFEATQQKEIDTIERNLNDASYLLERANDYMTDYLSGNMDSLYQNLVDWNSVYGTGFEADVISKWEQAIKLVQEFNSLSASGGAGFNFADYGQQNSYEDSVIEAMNKNRSLWKSADADMRKALNEKNIALGKTIGYSYKDDGNYYSDKDGSKLMFDNGGYKPKGVTGYMAEGVEEWVLKDGQIQAMQEMAIESMLNRIGLRSPSLGNASGNMGDVNIYIESVTDNNVARIERSIKETVKEVSQGQLDAFKSRGYVPSVKIR